MKRDVFDSVWFLRLISLVAAIFLYIFVAQETQIMTAGPSQEFATSEITETITEVPLVQVGQDENLVVTGLPKTVTVRLNGPRNSINRINKDRLEVRTESLTDLPAGRQSIRLLIENLPEEISYQISPPRVLVNITRLGQAEWQLDYELDEALIPVGYRLDSVLLAPNSVSIHDDRKQLDKIDRVYVRISEGSFEQGQLKTNLPIIIEDQEGNEMSLETNVDQVEVQVNLQAISRQVPINIVPYGEQSQWAYSYQIQGSQMAEISGAEEIINSIQSINAVVDVSQITSSQTLLARVSNIDGLHNVEPEQIEVYVAISSFNNQADQTEVLDQLETTEENSQAPVVGETSQEETVQEESSLNTEETTLAEISNAENN